MQPRRYNTANTNLDAAYQTTTHSRLDAYRANSGNGIDFVRCGICGKHLRLVTGTHLTTQGTDRESYMQKYRLGRFGFSPAGSDTLQPGALITVSNAVLNLIRGG